LSFVHGGFLVLGPPKRGRRRIFQLAGRLIKFSAKAEVLPIPGNHAGSTTGEPHETCLTTYLTPTRRCQLRLCDLSAKASACAMDRLVHLPKSFSHSQRSRCAEASGRNGRPHDLYVSKPASDCATWSLTGWAWGGSATPEDCGEVSGDRANGINPQQVLGARVPTVVTCNVQRCACSLSSGSAQLSLMPMRHWSALFRHHWAWQPGRGISYPL